MRRAAVLHAPAVTASFAAMLTVGVPPAQAEGRCFVFGDNNVPGWAMMSSAERAARAMLVLECSTARADVPRPPSQAIAPPHETFLARAAWIFFAAWSNARRTGCPMPAVVAPEETLLYQAKGGTMPVPNRATATRSICGATA